MTARRRHWEEAGIMRVVLAFSNEGTARKIRQMLDGTGLETDRAVCRTGAELLRRIESYDEPLVIMGYKLPDMVVDEVYENAGDDCRIISIVKPERLDDIANEDIFVIPLPVSRQKLLSSIGVFLGRVPEEKPKGGRSPEDAKLIDEAKLLLMERFHMTEQQAHRFIQKRSMDTGAKFVDTAKLILNM